MTKFITLSFIILLSGCTSLQKLIPPEHSNSLPTSPTNAFQELSQLPKPNGAIPVTVYSFRDQSGQYKALSTGSTFSTAVTQGATSILTQALSDSMWFIPLEREGLQNILTERKITRAANKFKKGANKLPPLTTAKLIIEGGIISYDSNIATGGIGAGYFGISASEKYREDAISIYMRAVDVRTGQVLLSVSTSKKVLSIEVRSGLNRFVSFKRLAEAEGGYTTNEPMHICVKQAIEKALTELIKKGIKRNIWQTRSKTIKKV